MEGRYAGEPFVAVNCGAIPENLLESEFSGYNRGAFTGAKDDRRGLFPGRQRRDAVPRRGRRPPPVMQVKLLRAIQEQKVADGRRHLRRCRSTCASSARPTRTSGAEVQSGRVPPGSLLSPPRHPARDAPAARDARLHSADRECHPHQADPRRRSSGALLDADAVHRSRPYPFPGNVRELENILQRGSRSLAKPDCASPPATCTSRPCRTSRKRPITAGDKWPLEHDLDRVERAAINEALEKTSLQPHRRGQAARASPSGPCATAWSGWGSSERSSRRFVKYAGHSPASQSSPIQNRHA